MRMYEFKEDDAYRFAKQIGQKVFKRGDELHFDSCPQCHGGKNHDKKTFAINLKSGMCKCQRASCGYQGNMITLARDFDFSLGNETDEYYMPKKRYRKLKTPDVPIVPKEPAVRYLESRGIDAEIAKKYEITTQKDHDNILVFPFFDENGQMQFVKYRKTDFDKEKDKNKEWCEANCKPILFGMKQCEDFTRLVCTEGQLDSLALASCGIKNAVSVPTGANGFTWVSYCYDWVLQFEEIVIFGDHEKGHITLVEDINRRFPNKVKRVREEDYMDCKDANELLMKHGRDAVIKAVENAVSIPVKSVKDLSDVERVDINKVRKLKTGIKELDITLGGGLPFGMVTLVTGKRNTGKSCFASQLMVNAVNQGYTTFAYSGEMPNHMYKSWFDFQVAGSNHIIENQDDFGIPQRFIKNQNMILIENWYHEKAYIYDNSIVESDEAEDLLKTIELAIRQNGVEVILIDNLMTAMYLDEEKGSDKYDKQGRFVRKLTRLALNYEVLIILVAHVRKNAFGGDANDEVSGSADITNLAGYVLSYARGTEQDIEKGIIDEDQRFLKLSKNRLTGKLIMDGLKLDYDEKSKRIYAEHDGLNRNFIWEDGESSYFNNLSDTDNPFMT